MLVIISYDVADDKRRAKIANLLENYGTRVQYSVFECLIEKEQLEEIKQLADEIISHSEDSLRYYIICEDCRKKINIMGTGEITSDPDFYIV